MSKESLGRCGGGGGSKNKNTVESRTWNFFFYFISPVVRNGHSEIVGYVEEFVFGSSPK